MIDGLIFEVVTVDDFRTTVVIGGKPVTVDSRYAQSFLYLIEEIIKRHDEYQLRLKI